MIDSFSSRTPPGFPVTVVATTDRQDLAFVVDDGGGDADGVAGAGFRHSGSSAGTRTSAVLDKERRSDLELVGWR